MSDVSATRVGTHNRFQIQLSNDASANRAKIDQMLNEAKSQFGAEGALNRFEFRLKSSADGVQYLELRNQSKFGGFREMINSRSGERASERQGAVAALAKAYPGLLEAMPGLRRQDAALGANDAGSMIAMTREDARSVRDLLTSPMRTFDSPQITSEGARKIIADGWTARENKVGTYSEVHGQSIYSPLIGDILHRSTLEFENGTLTMKAGGTGSDGEKANLDMLSQVTSQATGLQKGTDAFDNALNNLFRYTKQDFEGNLVKTFADAVKDKPPFLGGSNAQTEIKFDDTYVIIERQASASNFQVFDKAAGGVVDSQYNVSLAQKFKIPISELSKSPADFDPLCIIDTEQTARVWEGPIDPRMPDIFIRA